MRKFLLTASALVGLTGGVAFAQVTTSPSPSSPATVPAATAGSSPSMSPSTSNSGEGLTAGTTATSTSTSTSAFTSGNTTSTNMASGNPVTTSSNNPVTSTVDNSNHSIMSTLKDSVLGNGSLSQTTTADTTNSILAQSDITGTVQHNRAQLAGGGSARSGDVALTNSLAGNGILQAQQNTGAGALQQQSVSLGSTVGGNGGGLSGFQH